jgi:Fe-S-cluster containining protein
MTRTLEQIYADVVDVECKGLCADACGPIGCTREEADRMRQASGFGLTVDATLTCGYLSKGRCSVYAVRPLVCRLYGAAAGLPCAFGCTPTITEQQAKDLIAEINASRDLVWSEPPAGVATLLPFRKVKA